MTNRERLASTVVVGLLMLGAIGLGLGLSTSSVPLAYAQPQLPVVYSGSVTLNGVPAPDGMNITAWDNGQMIGSTLTSGGQYSLQVCGHAEACNTGDLISFKLNDLLVASQTATLDLSLRGCAPNPCPILDLSFTGQITTTTATSSTSTTTSESSTTTSSESLTTTTTTTTSSSETSSTTTISTTTTTTSQSSSATTTSSTTISSSVTTTATSTTSIVTPPSLTLTPASGVGGTAVAATGSGYRGTICTLSSSPSGLFSSNSACSISGGILTGAFAVATGASGSYMVTVATDVPGETASAIFTVTFIATTTTEETTAPSGPRCVIATAAYGSEMAPEVVYMRYVRDNLIGSTPIGRSLVDAFNRFYYSWSPTLAVTISQYPPLQATFRVLILPLVGIVHATALIFATMTLMVSRDLASTLAFLSAAFMTLVTYLTVPAFLVVRLRRLIDTRRRAGQ